MKDKKNTLAIIGLILSVLAAAAYAALYGFSTGSMNCMSWPAVWILGAGAVADAVLIFIARKPRFGAYIMALASLAAFCLSVYAFNTYISAAFVGIDSTWEAPFFIVMGLLAASLTVNAIAAAVSMPVKSKGLKTAVPVLTILFGILVVGAIVAGENAPTISGFLKTPTFREVSKDVGEEDTQYYKSAYTSLDSLMAAGRDTAEETMAEGVVLLKNENGALPLNVGSSLSLFSVSSVDPVYGGTGSGSVEVATAPSWKTAFERNGNFSVNETLWNWYAAEEQAGYRRTTGSTGRGVTGAKTIGDAPWNAVKEANSATFVQYGDAAIVFIARLGGEGSDMPRGEYAISRLNDAAGSQGDTTDGDYLKLSPVEQDLLRGLKAEKEAGTIKKIVVVLNFANQVETAFLDDEQYGVDAALWIGTPGQVGMYAVSDILAGKVNPSGRLSATFWADHSQNPSLANFGPKAYEGAPAPVNDDGSLQQDSYYMVYQEGIYLGYRYTETRYEDYVMGTPNTGSFDYDTAISYPFGYGQSYTSFGYSDYSVQKTGSGADTVYNVSVKVTNSGSAAGKEVVQIYLQKPYGDYNRQNSVEASSVELVGFTKTKLLAPGESQTVTIPVKERQFAAYDSENAKTYVIVDGDYYLTAARDAHDAVNNILAKKGFSPAGTDGRMDAEGAAALVSDRITLGLDKETFATSEATGYKITNQFEYADWNKYEHRGDDTVTYMSRSDWEGTTPKNWDDHVVLHWSQQLRDDQDMYGKQGETKLAADNGEYPAFGKISDEYGRALSLIELRVDADGNEIPYDDPMWDALLDQLTWDEIANLIPAGMRCTGQIASINKMETLDHNGPSGLTESYKAGARGLATLTDDPDKDSKAMCYPAGGILAATFNTDLMYSVGDLIGEDALWAGYNGLYGPGSNIQRTPYSGRNFEYYSEDGYLSGMICAYECAAMENHGLYVYNKHVGLNDQEDLRRGISIWANEQAIREIYMRAFELPITIAGTEYNGQTLKGASGVMLAFNRMGNHWSGMQRGMVTEFLRNECGMTGIVVTDMWYGTASTYMNLPAMLTAGSNLVDGMMKAEHLDECRTGHADVAWGMRESAHRILYTVVHSNAMNGVSSGTTIERITPWWQTALLVGQILLGVLALGAMVLAFLASRKSGLSKNVKFIALILALLLVIAAVVTIVVAKQANAPSETAEKTQTAVATAAPAAAATEAPAATAAPAPTAAPAAAPVAAASATPASFAGEYDLVITNADGEQMDMYEFIVDEDGKLHGAGDDSGMTTFEGTVNADGSFSGTYLRFDGSSITGKIEANGYVSGQGEIRGRVNSFESRGGRPAEVAPAETTSASFAGEYDLVITNADGEQMDMYEFIVDEDGKLHGAGDDSGMTTFEGTVNADGSFSGTYLRFDGSSISGKIETNGYVSGQGEIRGRVNSFESRGGRPAEAAAAPAETTPASFAGEYDLVITNAEGEKMDMYEFIVDEDGKLHGAGDDSGMTTFEGTVNADGSFSGTYLRFDGSSISGKIETNGYVSGQGEIRGRVNTFESRGGRPAEAAAAPAETTPASFAGEYDLVITNADGEKMDMYEFIVDEDGKLHGAGDDSGMTTFEGMVNADGSFSGTYLRFDGSTITGKIEANGYVSGQGEIRGRVNTFESRGGRPAEAAAAPAETTPASFAGEYDLVITNAEGEKMDMYEFIVDKDGKLHGAGDDSGMTTFEGTVNADGSFSGTYLRFDGSTITGKIEANGYVSGQGEIRGRVNTFESRNGKAPEMAAPAETVETSPAETPADASDADPSRPVISTAAYGEAPEKELPAVTACAAITGADCPQAQFAAGDIETALRSRGIGLGENPEWTIVFAPIDDSLGREAYRVTVADRTITITGADTSGLMYGGLEVAELISLYGLEGVADTEGAPYVQNRGMLCPVPMDMRTPSYNSPGENAQKNIGTVWEMDFWHEYLDNLARNRMNTVQVWTCNSFPSLVKVEGYEDIALNDVWRSNVPLGNNYKGDLTNAVRPEDWEDYEVVKEMTIEEKIAFWQEVMAYAKDRGIGFLFLFRHIYTFGEQGKYGITNDQENEVLCDYLGRSMKALIETYPDLIGVGLNPGENMGWDNSDEGVQRNMQWMHDVYVPGINEALAATPDREFQVMFQEADKQVYMDMYADLNCNVTFVRGYTSTHMYATSTPRNSDMFVEMLPEGAGLWLNCRNEDNFDMRWGDPDFMIDFVNNIPADKVLGLVTGSDGYFYGKDYSSTDPVLQGQQYMKKHWYNYMLLGRLMYDNHMSRERIDDIFAAHYDGMDSTETLYRATSAAGKIIPEVNKVYTRGNSDYTWFVAGNWSHPSAAGYQDIKRWMKSTNVLDVEANMSIEEYAFRLAEGDESEPVTETPVTVAENLRAWANETLALTEEIRASRQPSEAMTFSEREFWALVSDDEAMAYLGLFYAERIEGAIYIRVFNETGDAAWQEKSVAHLERSAEYFARYAEIISSNYIPQYLARVGYFNVNDILVSVQKDVSIAQKWTHKDLPKSWNPPAKSNYFEGAPSSGEPAQTDGK